MKLNKLMMLAGLAAGLCLCVGNLGAQDNQGQGGQGGNRGGRGGPGGGRGGPGGGNFDPAQFQQRMMDNIREQFGVKDDAEWTVIKERVQKVMDARREVPGGNSMRNMFRRPGGDTGGGGGTTGRGGFGGEPSAAEQALQRAIDSKASKEELKKAMDAYRDDRKAKEAKLREAQEELKKVLPTVQMEATALSMSLVN